MEKYEHPFSWEALLRIIIMGIAVILAWKALGVLPSIIVSFVLAAAFYPVIKRVHIKTRIPIMICIFLILIVPVALIAVFAVYFIPHIVTQIPILLVQLNLIIGQIPGLPSFMRNFNLLSYIQSHLDYASATVNITLVMFSVLTTLFLTFFLIYDYEKLFELFLNIVPGRERTKVKELLEEVSVVTGKYIRGNLLISLICAVVVFAILTVLHVPFALPLAIFASVMDLLPLVGQTLGAIPAVIIGFGVSPLTGLLVIILHLAYQQVENGIIGPLVYKKALNLYPSVSFLAVLLGGSLFGILGAFLALPVAASIPVIIHYHKNYKARHETE